MTYKLPEIKYTTNKFIEEFTLTDGDRILKLLSAPCSFVSTEQYEDCTKNLMAYKNNYCIPWCIDVQGSFFQEQIIKKSFVDSDGSEHTAIVPATEHFMKIAEIMNSIGYTIQEIETDTKGGKPDIRVTLSNGIQMKMRWKRVGDGNTFRYQTDESYAMSTRGSLKYSSLKPGMSACKFAIEGYGSKEERIRIWMNAKFPNVYLLPFVVYKKDLSKNLHMSK